MAAPEMDSRRGARRSARCVLQPCWFLGRLLILLLTASCVLCAQRIAIGATAGVPVTETIYRGNLNRTGVDPRVCRYTFGPALELGLAGPLSVRFEALYQRFSFHQAAFSRYILDSNTTGILWQFPVLLRFRIPIGGLKPFLTAGPSFQSAAWIVRTPTFAGAPGQVLTPEHRTIAGPAAGAGLDIGSGRLRVSPEVRYTRWGDQTVLTDINRVSTKVDQLQVLVGFSFHFKP